MFASCRDSRGMVGWGQALLIRRGLAAWMHAWPREIVESAIPPVEPAASECGSAMNGLGNVNIQELTQVLANRTLDNLEVPTAEEKCSARRRKSAALDWDDSLHN